MGLWITVVGCVFALAGGILFPNRKETLTKVGIVIFSLGVALVFLGAAIGNSPKH